MSHKYGYVRVSTREQNPDRQLQELRKLGVSENRIYIDKLSGKDFNRPAYQTLTRRRIRKGDLILIKSLDRLGRNYFEILDEWKYITREKQADIRILDMPLLDTSVSQDLIGTLISNLVLELLSFVAENERTMIRQRQAEGIRIAREKGVHLGRPVSGVPEAFVPLYRQWLKRELPPQLLIKKSGYSYQKFYRYCRLLKQQEETTAEF